MKKHSGAIMLAAALLLASTGCDLVQQGTAHAQYGGFQGCASSTTHGLDFQGVFRSDTYEDLSHPCVSVAARLFVRDFNGYYFATGWIFDQTRATSSYAALSSDIADHQICVTTTWCAGGRN